MTEPETKNADGFGLATKPSRPRGTGAGLLVGVGCGSFALAFILLAGGISFGMSRVESDSTLQIVSGLILLAAGAVSGLWASGWLWRWGMRRVTLADIRARLPDFTGRTVPVGQLVSGPVSAGSLKGNYLLAAGADRFLLLRHFHSTDHLDSFRAWAMGQFINAYRPDGLARPLNLTVPFAAIASVRVRTVSDQALREGAFGRAVKRGLATAALDATLGIRSTGDIDAAFIEIAMKDGESLVFGVPSRVSPAMIAALSATAQATASEPSGDASLGAVAADGVLELMERTDLIDSPVDGWDVFLEALHPKGERARAFAALAALRVRQETGPLDGEAANPDPSNARERIVPQRILAATIATIAPFNAAGRDRVCAEARSRLDQAMSAARVPLLEEERVAAIAEMESRIADWMDRPLQNTGWGRLQRRPLLAMWGIALLVLASLAMAAADALRLSGSGILQLPVILIAIGVAAGAGAFVFGRRSGYSLAAVQSAVSVIVAGTIATALGLPTLVAAPFGQAAAAVQVPATPVMAPIPASIPAPAPAPPAPPPPPPPTAEPDGVLQEAARLKAAEAFVRALHRDENWTATGGSPAELRHWLTSDLARAVETLDRATDGHGVGFDPSVGSNYIYVTEARYQTRADYNGAAVRVHFLNVGQPRDITYELVETADGWRVKDLVGRKPDGSQAWRFTTLMREVLRRAEVG